MKVGTAHMAQAVDRVQIDFRSSFAHDLLTRLGTDSTSRRRPRSVDAGLKDSSTCGSIPTTREAASTFPNPWHKYLNVLTGRPQKRAPCALEGLLCARSGIFGTSSEHVKVFIIWAPERRDWARGAPRMPSMPSWKSCEPWSRHALEMRIA